MERRFRGQKLSSLGYQQLTVSSASVGFSSVPTGALGALIVCETSGVRWRSDGTAPTATVGMPLEAGGVLEFDGDLKLFRAIRKDGADAKLNIEFYG